MEMINSDGDPFEVNKFEYGIHNDNILAIKAKNGNFVSCDFNGNIYNPNERCLKNKLKLLKCSKRCYNSYVKFLKTKNKVFLERAQRSLFDEG